MTTRLRIILLVSSLLTVLHVQGQGTVQGVVMDAQTKQRVCKVYIYNPSNDAGGYNNTRGEFTIEAEEGDVLIAAVEGYYPDTISVTKAATAIFQLHRSAIRIQEVPIVVRRSPEELLKRNQTEYGTAYSKGSPGPYLTTGPTGAGLSIDALYKLISREGRNARRLQEILERDYRESVIDYRFTPELVSRSTGLTGEELRDFMQQYRPSYFFVLGASEYNLIFYIRSSLAKYRQNPEAFKLPPLRPDSTHNPLIP